MKWFRQEKRKEKTEEPNGMIAEKVYYELERERGFCFSVGVLGSG